MLARQIDRPTDPETQNALGSVVSPSKPAPGTTAPVVAARVAFQPSDSPEFDMDVAIGVVPAHGTCAPENDAWRGGPMFGKSDVRTASGYKFCMYRRVSTVVGASALPPYCPNGTCSSPSKIAVPASAWLEPVPHALLRQASPEAARRVATAVRAQLQSELRGLTRYPIGAAPPVLRQLVGVEEERFTTSAALPARAVIHVLDDASEHGNAVAALISATACPPSDSAATNGCSIDIRRHDVFEIEPGSAVERGSAAGLAQLIAQLTDQANGTPTVINLSLGFHPEAVWGQHPASRAEPGVLQIGHLALQAAINYARCQGVIVVSAAGNRDGGGSDGDVSYDGFMFPAAWHTSNGWTCGTTTPVSANEPLLYAASAVRGDGRPVASARPNGEAPLVAPGFVNTVDTATGLGRWYWEGSSFATAAISASAARVRSYMPFEPNGLKIMRTLWESGAPMPHSRMSSGLGYGSLEVRRIRICHSVRAALGVACAHSDYSFACAMQSALACSEPPHSPWPGVSVTEDRDLLDDETAGALATLWQLEGQGPLPSQAACGSGVRVLGAPDVWAEESALVAGLYAPDTGTGVWNPPNPRNAYSCPFETLGNGQQDSLEIGHQPGSTGCHGCVVYRTSSNKLVFTGTFAEGWAEISSSPALRTRGVSSSAMARVIASPESATTSALAASSDEALYELGDALNSAQPLTFELTDAAPASLDDLEVVLEYVVQHGQQSYSVAQTVPLIDLL
jgi:hypothetical protein